MKKLIILCCLMAVSLLTLQAQEDSVVVKKSGSWGFNFANVGLSNWAAGGENSISLGTVFNTKIVRTHGLNKWTNQFDFALGGAKVGEQEFRKTDDNIILISKYGHQLNDEWSYSISGIFRTQVLEGFNFRQDPLNPGQEVQEKISNFMAPGYLNVNLGMSFDPSDALTISFAPAAGKFTFVADDELSAAGAYGVDPGKKSRAEFGTNLLIVLDFPVAENIKFQSNINFFTGYSTFGNVDTNLETLLVMKVNEWFNATFGTQLIYDDDILIDQGDGGAPQRAIQFKHVLNFGVNFSLFSN